ncbi:MAG: hypothetical protein ACK5C8_09215 [Roseiflexaceae bacterium]|jgi:hypothetical protein|nr:hypothetical protein [Chloroflexaceae bacterium]
MYIRWIVRHHKNADTANVSFFDAYLVESFRDDSGQPRQRTICYLGNIRQINEEFPALEREIFFLRAARIIAGVPSLSTEDRQSVAAMLRQKVPELSPLEVETAFRNNLRWFRYWRQQRGMPITQAELNDMINDNSTDFSAM